jgi:hypothetical protein
LQVKVHHQYHQTPAENFATSINTSGKGVNDTGGI